jgi:threonine aldolase
MRTIDLRSDTVTQPGPGMREAMRSAEVGDDVLGEDPTVARLQERMAEQTGKEAALFVPSGTMANQLALRAQTEPGDQAICHLDSHVFRYEAGGPAALSGLLMSTISTADGSMPWEAVDQALNPDDVHCAPPRLLCFENTHNRCGGRVLDPTTFAETARQARARGLRVHLDGARLWNASVALGRSLRSLTEPADTVSLCFSKGLGAPVGSVLCGDQATIARAWRLRKQWGGGMRQVGILAAACLYALDHHVERLSYDHANALRLAERLEHPELRLAWPPESNIVLCDVVGDRSALELAGLFADRGVLVSTFGPKRIRLVTHLDVSTPECDEALSRIRVVTS